MASRAFATSLQARCIAARRIYARCQSSVAGAAASIDEDAVNLMAPAVWRGMRRFYPRVEVLPAVVGADESAIPVPVNLQGQYTQWWQVHLSGRAMRTNAASELIIPSYPLALAVAAEFARVRPRMDAEPGGSSSLQGEVIASGATPLYNLVSSALDSYASEDGAAVAAADALDRAQRVHAMQVALRGAAPASLGGSVDATGRAPAGALSNRSSMSSGSIKLRDVMIDFLETDSICYRVDRDAADASEGVLFARQEKVYGRVAAWWRDTFGPHAALGTVTGFSEPVHPDAAFMVVEDAVDRLDPFRKAALGAAVTSLKSSSLALALVYGAMDATAVIEAARLEEEWQIEENGFVEDGHDTARCSLRAAVGAAHALSAVISSTQPLPVTLPSKRKGNYQQVLQASIEERERRVVARRAHDADLLQHALQQLRATSK